MTQRMPPEELNRKLIHLGTGIIAPGYWLAGREITLVVLGILTLLILAAELLRLSNSRAAALYERYFGNMTRRSEARHLTGATYLLAGALLSVALFPPVVTVLVILFMSWGDTVAALVGLRWGRIRLGRKSLEGSLACFIVCLLITLPADLTISTKVAGAAAATLAELVPWGVLDDNLVIPIFSGGVMLYMMSSGL